MEGVPFIPPHHPRGGPDHICEECGRAFQPRVLEDIVEDLCDTCYDAQFELRPLRRWQRSKRQHSSR